MNNDQFGFTCPRCEVDLIVPKSAAGVEGPCPRCGGFIRAPELIAKEEEAPLRLEVQPERMVRAGPVAGFQPTPQPPDESVVQSAGRLTGLRGMGWTLLGVLAFGLAVALIILIAISGTGEKERGRSPAQRDAYADVEVVMRDVQSGDAPPVEMPVEVKTSGVLPSSPEGGRPAGKLKHRDAEELQGYVEKSAAVVSTFLFAQTLEDRLPLIETQTAREELEVGALARPIRTNGVFESLEIKFNEVEGFNDVIFKVVIADENGMNGNYILLVRTRGNQSPKVVVDPFLDSFGGRFGEFATSPQQGEKKFSVLATIYEFCNDETIPDSEGKCSVKIAMAPSSHEIAKAYFGKASPLRQKLERMGIRYGWNTMIRATFRWNTVSKPYLEVVEIDSLDWED